MRSLIRGISQLEAKSKNGETQEVSKYDKYLSRLKLPLSTAESALTARKLAAWLDQFYCKNPAEPWLAGKKLIAKGMPHSVRSAGFELLRACIESRSDLSVVLRYMFFSDIEKLFSPDGDLDLQLKALRLLSKDGRDLSGFADQICPLMCVWVDRAIANLDMHKACIRRGHLMSHAQRHADLQEAMLFMMNIAKFHFSLLQEQDIVLMTGRVIQVCKRTSDEKDIALAIDFVDANIRYGYIPSESLNEVVSVICSVFRSLPSQRSGARGVLQKLIRSHMSHATRMSIRNLINGKRNVHDDVVLGALELLRALWLDADDEDRVVLHSSAAVFEAIKQGIEYQVRRHDRNWVKLDNGYVSTLFYMLKHEYIAKELSYDDWAIPFDIITQGTRALDKSSENVLQHREEDSQDPQHLLHQTYTALNQYLEQLYTSEEFNGPVDRLMAFWSSIYEVLPATTAALLLNWHHKELNCYPNNAQWLVHIETLGKQFWAHPARSTEVRLQALRQFSEVMDLLAGQDASSALHDCMLGLLQQVDATSETPVKVEGIALIARIAIEGNQTHADRARSMLHQMLLIPGFKETAEPSPATNPLQFQRKGSLESLTSLVSSRGQRKVAPSIISSDPREPLTPKVETALSTAASAATQGLVSAFLKAFTSTPSARGQQIFEEILMVIGSPQYFEEARCQLINVLSRIRSDMQHVLYMDRDASEVVASAIDTFTYISPDQNIDIRSRYCCKGEFSLPVSEWLNMVCNLMQEETSWRVYETLCGATQRQLSNKHLFESCGAQIQRLRSLICEQLMSARPPVVRLPSDVKREDIMTILAQLLSLVVGYHSLFNKSQSDEVVAALQNVLTRYQKASTACIHTLTLCAYELPLSCSKILSQILMRLSQLITSTNASVHILEFLNALAKLPDLYVNFREEDYRRIFGIALQHIQYANASSRDALAASQTDPLTQPMPVYVLAQAMDVVYSWFLALKLPQRPRYLKWIVDGLLAANPQSKSLDERGQVCYDFLMRFCYSNAEIRSIGTVFADFEADQSTSKSWLYGNAILTLRTMHLSGLTELTVRRPTGSVTFLCKPNSDLEALSFLSASEAKDIISDDTLVGPTEAKIRTVLSGQDATIFTPSHILLQVICPPEIEGNDKPLLLPDDDTTRRAIGTFDRIPVVDFHKIGIIYVGRGQREQAEILANTHGSLDYVEFLDGLGDLVRLKENKSIYTGGLDTSNDEDGEFAYAYKEKVTQIIFHTCSLMPSNLERDPACTRKKSHIGNDFVNIIWNNANRPYERSTIPSEFNFVNIVISPDAYQSRLRPSLADEQEQEGQVERFYKIKVLPHDSLPPISPASEWRLVSASRLPVFVRTVAMHCNLYAQVHHAGGDFTGMWKQRLLRIQMLRQRVGAKREEQNHALPLSASTNSGTGSVLGSGDKGQHQHQGAPDGYDFVSFN
ncbi:hypothetical protein BCR37DRAFT_377225 [Protomyces lactucae-debilis]|uniref:Rap-GAP domain-containing protein n=1 Tax=Protomyces lactucae-debilis TaxID=2754530 RepID=A0A1Y2FNK5_PROLT|nr:uncharacterized protein BCR37DRAFT_377225 [Protomyces lactucae-debilis]ORY85548.1 hypothetical protein BCR37DRAFT_377225 [Protomyces lactucae-debilis]